MSIRETQLNTAKCYLMGAVVPLITTALAIWLTVHACNDWQLGLTKTASLGLYSFSCIAVSMCTTIMCIAYARLKIRNAAEAGKWEEQLPYLKKTCLAVALSAVTCIATVFASEYLPHTGLPDICCKAICGVGLPAALYTIWLLKIRDLLEDPDDKKEVLGYLTPAAMIAITILGTIFASQYLPNISSNMFPQAVTGCVSVLGLGALALSILHLHRENEKFWNYLLALMVFLGTILATIYASQHLPETFSSSGKSVTCAMIAILGTASGFALGRATRSKEEMPPNDLLDRDEILGTPVLK